MKNRFFIALIFLIPIVNAIPMPIPIVIPSSDGNNQGGCFPPINFSVQNNCDLRLASSHSVNDFGCGCYKVKGDCMGGVLTAVYNEDRVDCPYSFFEYFIRSKWGIASIFILLIEIIGIVWMFRYFKKKRG